MPDDGSGVYSLPPSYRVENGDTTDASQHNPPLEDIAQAMSNRLYRDGRTSWTGNQNANSNRLTNVGNPTAGGDAVNRNSAASSAALNLASPTPKATPVDADRLLLMNSEDSNAAVPVLWSALKTFRAVNDGATGVQLTTQHISASPAANDVILDIIAQGKDSAANTDTYGSIQHVISDPVTATEDSYWSLLTRVAGALAERVRVAAGLVIGAATGGDKGAGTLNAAVGVYVAGARLGGAPDVVLEDQKPSGTNAGAATAGTWQTRTVNTEVRDPSSLCTLASNEFTFTVDGWVDWTVPACRTNANKTRLYNVTDNTVAGVGTTAYNQQTGDVFMCTSVGGASVIAGKAYRIEHRVSDSHANGWGTASGFTSIEVYSRIFFWRTA